MIEVGRLAAISVNAKIKNTSSERMYYSYNVAFFDKDKNLIGCQVRSTPGWRERRQHRRDVHPSSPRDEIAKIAYYSVALHESDKQIGTKGWRRTRVHAGRGHHGRLRQLPPNRFRPIWYSSSCPRSPLS